MALNCWEYLKCGREPGGRNVEAKGICPAARELRTNGTNSGMNGGRVCWAIQGTHCCVSDEASTFDQISKCLNCGFYRMVKDEEGMEYKNTSLIMRQLI